MAYFIEPQVKFLSFQIDLLVSQSIDHLGEELFKASLITSHSNGRVLHHLLYVNLSGVEAEHNNLLDLVFEDFY